MRIFALQLHLLLLAAIPLPAQAPPDPAVRTYSVTNAVTFPALNGPSSMLVYRNGLFQTPGTDYVLFPATVGTRFAFRPGTLANNDRISVVALPVIALDLPLVKTFDTAGNPHVGILDNAVPPPITGAGLIIEPIQGTSQYRADINRQTVFYRAAGSGIVPLIGTACTGDAGVQVDRGFIYVCVPPAAPPADGTPGYTWAGAALQLPPPPPLPVVP